MKDRIEIRHIRALYWSKPVDMGGRLRKYSPISKAVEELWNRYTDEFKAAGFVLAPGDNVPRLWWWSMGGEFKMPGFPKKETKSKTAPSKDSPVKQGDLFLESFGENVALKMKIETLTFANKKLQEQFEEVQRLYRNLKEVTPMK